MGRLAPRLQLPGPHHRIGVGSKSAWPSTQIFNNTSLHAHVLLVPGPGAFWLLSVPAPWYCHLPLSCWLLLLEEPAPCVFHMPSFDATALRGPTRPRCLQRAIIRCDGSCALCAERDRAVGRGAKWPRIVASSPILLHNSGFPQRNSLYTEAGVTSFSSFNSNLESIYCLSSLESVVASSHSHKTRPFLVLSRVETFPIVTRNHSESPLRGRLLTQCPPPTNQQVSHKGRSQEVAPARQVLLKVCGIYLLSVQRATIPRFLASALRSPSLIVVPDSALFRTATVRPIRGPIIPKVISVFLIVLLD